MPSDASPNSKRNSSSRKMWQVRLPNGAFSIRSPRFRSPSALATPFPPKVSESDFVGVSGAARSSRPAHPVPHPKQNDY